jgi:hypothetical protein
MIQSASNPFCAPIFRGVSLNIYAFTGSHYLIHSAGCYSYRFCELSLNTFCHVLFICHKIGTPPSPPSPLTLFYYYVFTIILACQHCYTLSRQRLAASLSDAVLAVLFPVPLQRRRLKTYVPLLQPLQTGFRPGAGVHFSVLLVRLPRRHVGLDVPWTSPFR